jgi:DNA-binding NtrC family response regulator
MPETETILLCDDEGGIRRLLRTILGRHGYHVLEAKNGKHAMVVAEAHAGPIHLLLSDVLMPELDGPGLAEQLQAIRPDVRVMSGVNYFFRLTTIISPELTTTTFRSGR